MNKVGPSRPSSKAPLNWVQDANRHKNFTCDFYSIHYHMTGLGSLLLGLSELLGDEVPVHKCIHEVSRVGGAEAQRCEGAASTKPETNESVQGARTWHSKGTPRACRLRSTSKRVAWITVTACLTEALFKLSRIMCHGLHAPRANTSTQTA